MRKTVILHINGKRYEIGGARAFTPFSDYLRYVSRLTGTKVVCAEGDCGACTVLVSRRGSDFIPVNSCITMPVLLDGAHIVTVEGLEDENGPHPVQDAMVRHHGSQCGFCTPGFVCALAGRFECDADRDEKKTRNALTGNLCRCTGYEPILKSAASVTAELTGRLKNRYLSDVSIGAELAKLAEDDLYLEAGGRSFFAPVKLSRLLKYKKDRPQARVVSAATDLGVLVNKGKASYQALCSLYRVPETSRIETGANAVTIGASVTLAELKRAVKDVFPEFCDLLNVFASPQIKNVATLVGNIANASPIADTLPFLFVMNAELEIRGHAVKRRVGINDFYRGYKEMDLAPEEIITAVRVPKLKANEKLFLHKVSRRKDLDISCVTSGYLFKMRGCAVVEARVAYGGVGPTVLRLPKTEEFLRGKALSLETFEGAGGMARSEVKPISDVRGSRDYRLRLVKNLFVKTYYDGQDGRTKYPA